MPNFKVIVRNSGPYRLEGEGITICDQEGRVYGALMTSGGAQRCRNLGFRRRMANSRPTGVRSTGVS